MIRMIILGVIDFIFYHAFRPVGFIARSMRDGFVTGFYSEELRLMAQLQNEPTQEEPTDE